MDGLVGLRTRFDLILLDFVLWGFFLSVSDFRGKKEGG